MSLLVRRNRAWPPDFGIRPWKGAADSARRGLQGPGAEGGIANCLRSTEPALWCRASRLVILYPVTRGGTKVYWHIEGPSNRLVLAWDYEVAGLTIHGSGRLPRPGIETDYAFMDEDNLKSEADRTNLDFEWHIRSMPHAQAVDANWVSPDDVKALDNLRAMTPQAAIARAVLVPASPPYLERPVVETRILVPDEAHFAQIRGICELTFGVVDARITVVLKMLGFLGPREMPNVGVATPRTAEFLQGNVNVYGRFYSLSVWTRRDGAVGARDADVDDADVEAHHD